MGEQGVMNHAPTRAPVLLVKIHHHAQGKERINGRAGRGEEIFPQNRQWPHAVGA
jgi:hypothetical protein